MKITVEPEDYSKASEMMVDWKDTGLTGLVTNILAFAAAWHREKAPPEKETKKGKRSKLDINNTSI